MILKVFIYTVFKNLTYGYHIPWLTFWGIKRWFIKGTEIHQKTYCFLSIGTNFDKDICNTIWRLAITKFADALSSN